MPWDDDRKKAGLRRWGGEGVGKESGKTRGDTQRSEGAKIDELLQRAEPMIEQVDSLYAQYFGGVEKLPPNGRRGQLESLMSQLSLSHKPNATYRFRVETITARFVTFRERWDKIMRDLESGKRRRRNPKRR